jgi:hypothetical protein
MNGGPSSAWNCATSSPRLPIGVLPVQHQPRAPEAAVQQRGQRLAHLAELREHQQLLAGLGDRARTAPAAAGTWRCPPAHTPRRPRTCDGWLQICLKLGQVRQDDPAPADPRRVRDLARQSLDRLRVQPGLHAREPAVDRHLRLVRQVGDHPPIRLHAPQDVRPDQRAQRPEPVALLREPLAERLELGLLAEQPRAREVQQRPQVDQRVLDRRAGQHQPLARAQPLDRARLLGLRVLDRLRLVEDHQPPRLRLQPRLAQQRPVGREHHVDRVHHRRRVDIPGAAMGHMHAQVGREAGQLGPPVAEQRRRQHDEVRTARPVPLQQQQQRDHLDRLPEPHVVGEAPAEPEPRQQPQPRDSVALVRPQFTAQRRPRVGLAAAPRVLQVRQRALEPRPRPRHRPHRPRRVGRQRPARQPREHPHALGERRPARLRRRLDVGPLPLRQRVPRRIDLQPPIAHAVQPARGPRQPPPLVLRQLLVAEEVAQPEVEQRRQPERGRLARADLDPHLRPQRRAARPLRDPQPHPAGRQRRRAAQQRVRLVGRPRDRMKDLVRTEQRADHRLPRAGSLERREQPRPPHAIELGRRGRQRLVQQTSVHRPPARDRRHESERPHIIRSLDQVKPHLPDVRVDPVPPQKISAPRADRDRRRDRVPRDPQPVRLHAHQPRLARRRRQRRQLGRVGLDPHARPRRHQPPQDRPRQHAPERQVRCQRRVVLGQPQQPRPELRLVAGALPRRRRLAILARRQRDDQPARARDHCDRCRPVRISVHRGEPYSTHRPRLAARRRILRSLTA